MILTITKENVKHEVQESKKPVVIDVFATWCGPCQLMKPLFEQLAQELGDSYVFGELNVDESRELAISYGVTSVPTFVFIKNNQVAGKATGYMSKDELQTKITQILG
jgi:thioredoxin 1